MRIKQIKYCNIEKCEKPFFAKGLCRKHYQRQLFVDVPHNTWSGMIKRCNNPNNRDYENYGGRGITVCDRWRGKNGFKNFCKDMGERPSLKHSIDRINNDGNYTPENCRWATYREQNLNKSAARIINYKGISNNITVHAENAGLTYKIVYDRIRRGWSVNEALETPKGKYHAL